MQTNDLIAKLTADLQPVPSGAVLKRIAAGVGVGALLALAGLLLSLGTDLSDALHTTAFWLKWGYGFAVSGIALWLCLRLARPERVSGTLLLVLAVPIAVLAVAAILEMVAAPAEARLQMWLGRSAPVCPWIIGALSVPLFAGVLWAFRRFRADTAATYGAGRRRAVGRDRRRALRDSLPGDRSLLHRDVVHAGHARAICRRRGDRATRVALVSPLQAICSNARICGHDVMPFSRISADKSRRHPLHEKPARTWRR